MLSSILKLIRFSHCQHKTISRIFAEKGHDGKYHGRHYVTCLDCGQRWAYSWEEMRIIEPISTPDVIVPCPVEGARRLG